MFCESYATGAGRPDYAYEGEFLYACSEWPSEGCAGCDFACDGGYWYSDTDLCAYQCGATLPQSVLDDLDEALGSEEGVVVQALMEHHPGKIAFNRERGAVQVFACGEKVVAQYPVTAGLLKQF